MIHLKKIHLYLYCWITSYLLTTDAFLGERKFIFRFHPQSLATAHQQPSSSSSLLTLLLHSSTTGFIPSASTTSSPTSWTSYPPFSTTNPFSLRAAENPTPTSSLSSTSSSSSSSFINPTFSYPSTPLSPRIQKIKEMLLQREILKDITASEFAIRLEVMTQNQTSIDYERLITKLNYDLNILTKKTFLPSSAEITNKLITRIQLIKEDLLLIAQNLSPKHFQELDGGDSSIDSPQVEKSNSKTEVDIGVSKLKSFRLIVREDGTVDWDGTIASGREVAKFGTELWERLNGKSEHGEESISLQSFFSPVEAKLPITKEIEHLTDIVQAMKDELQQLTNHRNTLLNEVRQQRVSSSTPTYASTEASTNDLAKIRSINEQIEAFSKKLQIMNLNLDMEKICTYIIQELEASTDPSEQRPLIAEVTLIDKQLSTLINQDLGLYSYSASSSESITPTNVASFSKSLDQVVEESTDDLISLIDEDELNLISNEVTDLKTRLGLDAQLKPSFDWGSLGKLTTEALGKAKAGLAYFGDGIKTLVSDVQYAWILILKAAQGYTLKPREVNAIRRTGKDLLTLIPFIIILIIPLTPIGHVLVFSFIQRYFPEFFPSCFQEKRINLKKLFSEIERKNQDELYLLSTKGENGAFFPSSPNSSKPQIFAADWNQLVKDFFKSFSSSNNSTNNGDNSK